MDFQTLTINPCEPSYLLEPCNSVWYVLAGPDKPAPDTTPFRPLSLKPYTPLPRGYIYTTIMELGSKSQNRYGFWGPNSIMVVYMNPLGYEPS